jgi:hypothetical protein
VSSFARTTSGDLDFSTHTLVIKTDPVVCAAWDLQDKFSLGLGEWFLDTSQGIPYLSVLGVKNPDLSAIRAMLRAVILSVPPIVSVQELSVTLNPKTRALAYNFRATADTGQVITGGAGQPFIVSPPVGG